ncbi:MAG TPA: hypothetical protein VFV33_03470 [Gemmatimonadaceae bacterium]|nr:hypothetical protein [Gemmatimonadaceae bacterium]
MAGCSLDGIAALVLTVPGASPTEWHGRIDLADTPRLWQPAGPDSALARFRDAVRARLGFEPEPRVLLERQRAIFASVAGPMRGEAELSQRVLDGQVGRIAPISCLEAMLWRWQDARFPMLTHPTEFGAYVLRRRGTPPTVRVYLSSDDRVGQRMREAVADSVRADVRVGYRLVAHLHNHPFLFDRVVGDRMWTTPETLRDVAGALAPSLSDVAFYRTLFAADADGEAWVTNGVHSGHYRVRALQSGGAAGRVRPP